MKELYKKLLNVQKEVGAITKDSTNPFFKSQYFDINGLLAELKPILNEQGLVVLQPLTEINGKLALETIIISVGEKYNGTVSGISGTDDEIISRITILPENPDPQKMGSAITYFRRYALQSFFLLQAQDDDGNDAKVKPVTKHTPDHKKDKKIDLTNEAEQEIGLEENG